MTLSVCMIVRDEEAVLARCLECVKTFADEIVIVDTGSSDDTVAIARRYTDRVFSFTWIDDFSAARNFAFSKGTMDYLMWLDADDVVPEETSAALNKLKESLPPEIGVVTMPYHTGFDEQDRPTFVFTRERIARRGLGRWREPVHEYLDAFGPVFPLDHPIHHRKPPSAHGKQGADRNLRIYEKTLEREGRLSPRGMYYYARELRDHGRWEDAIRWFSAFLDGGEGWLEDNIAACNALADCQVRLGRYDRVLPALFQGFVYDTPRAEACCSIGYEYKRRGDLKRAVFWFELATRLDVKDIQGFVQPDYASYIPHIELCVCWHGLGDLEKAVAHNEAAALAKPNAASVLQNRAFFESLKHPPSA